MINSNLRCKDNTFSENINTFTKIIQKKNAEYWGECLFGRRECYFL